MNKIKISENKTLKLQDGFTPSSEKLPLCQIHRTGG